MWHILKKISVWISFAFISMAVIGQTTDCPAIVETALNSVDAVCNGAGRNQACYANVLIETQLHSEATGVIFANVGDIADVTSILSMQLSPMDEANGKWGLAMMRLQANIPDTSPGQNVTFLLFGDVEIIDASADFPNADLTPMHAFYLKTGVGDANCTQAPDSGVLVQTPDGVTDVVFNVNGVDVAMGSTILFQAEPSTEMHVHTLEGSALMELDGDIHTAVAGTRLRIPIDENFQPTGPPPLPESYDEDMINRIPHQHLERQIMPPPALTEEQLAQAHTMIGNGQLPCGMEGFPDCEKLPIGGLREGPLCQHDPAGCSERLAPHEGKGIRQPENREPCVGETCGDHPQADVQLPQNGTPPPREGDYPPSEPQTEGSDPSERGELPPDGQGDGEPPPRGEFPVSDPKISSDSDGEKPPREGN